MTIAQIPRHQVNTVKLDNELVPDYAHRAATHRNAGIIHRRQRLGHQLLHPLLGLILWGEVTVQVEPTVPVRLTPFAEKLMSPHLVQIRCPPLILTQSLCRGVPHPAPGGRRPLSWAHRSLSGPMPRPKILTVAA